MITFTVKLDSGTIISASAPDREQADHVYEIVMDIVEGLEEEDEIDEGHLFEE